MNIAPKEKGIESKDCACPKIPVHPKKGPMVRQATIQKMMVVESGMPTGSDGWNCDNPYTEVNTIAQRKGKNFENKTQMTS
jgi:hypothetical protein